MSLLKIAHQVVAAIVVSAVEVAGQIAKWVKSGDEKIGFVYLDYYENPKKTATISAEAGTVVYLTTEPSGSGAVATIDLYGFESGSYTITFTNTDTFFNYGEFVF